MANFYDSSFGLHLLWDVTRFNGHSRSLVSSCSSRQGVVELLEVGGADHSEAGVPALGDITTFDLLKHLGCGLDPAGPGFPVE